MNPIVFDLIDFIQVLMNNLHQDMNIIIKTMIVVDNEIHFLFMRKHKHFVRRLNVVFPLVHYLIKRVVSFLHIPFKSSPKLKTLVHFQEYGVIQNVPDKRVMHNKNAFNDQQFFRFGVNKIFFT